MKFESLTNLSVEIDNDTITLFEGAEIIATFILDSIQRELFFQFIWYYFL
jgi:hypothetical protein